MDDAHEDDVHAAPAAAAAAADTDDGDAAGEGANEGEDDGRDREDAVSEDLAKSGDVSQSPRPNEETARRRRRPRHLPPRIYNPPSLMECCLATVAERPDVAILQQDLYGLGQDVLVMMLLAIIHRGNLTVPLVRRFETVAKEEGHELIRDFVARLDIFAAI